MVTTSICNLDNELIDVEHLYYLTHAKAKFKHIYNQGCSQTSELMSKALNYVKSFCTQIFAYKNASEYSIDNLPA